jgi:hypothetical protein
MHTEITTHIRTLLTLQIHTYVHARVIIIIIAYN